MTGDYGPPPSTPPQGDTPTPHPSAAGCLRPLGAVLIGLLVLVAVGLGAALGRCSRPAKPKPAASVTVVRGTPSVVTAIRELSSIEGARFHIEKVIDLTEKQSHFFGLVHAKDAILLVAAGDVTAGVDLAGLRDGDVKVDRQKGTAEITLPPAKVLSHRLDNQHTYVHSRSTDLLAERKSDLETRARQEAEKSIVEAARKSRILPVAEGSVKRTVESLVRSLGYPHVTVKFRHGASRSGFVDAGR